MSNTGFTIGYNCILRDKSLSLTAKGLISLFPAMSVCRTGH